MLKYSTRTSKNIIPTCPAWWFLTFVSCPYRNGIDTDPSWGVLQEDQVTLVLPGTCSYLFWQLGIWALK